MNLFYFTFKLHCWTQLYYHCFSKLFEKLCCFMILFYVGYRSYLCLKQMKASTKEKNCPFFMIFILFHIHYNWSPMLVCEFCKYLMKKVIKKSLSTLIIHCLIIEKKCTVLGYTLVKQMEWKFTVLIVLFL